MSTHDDPRTNQPPRTDEEIDIIPDTEDVVETFDDEAEVTSPTHEADAPAPG